MPFGIEDEFHAEPMGVFATLDAAVAELRRLARIAWHEPPNRAPCTNWRKCGRIYELVEFDDTRRPWKELRRTAALEVTAKGVTWLPGFDSGTPIN